MTRSDKLLRMTFAVFFTANVSNANDVGTYNPDEARAEAIQFAIAEGISTSKANEEFRAKLEEEKLEAIRTAVTEAIRLSNHCGSAVPRNCVHSK